MGATLGPDRFGNPGMAYSFDGVDDYIITPTDDFLDQQESGTVALWFNSDHVPGTSGFPEGKLFSYSTFGTDQSIYGLAIQDDGRVKVGYKYSDPKSPTLFTVQTVLDGQWHHLAVVANGIDPLVVYLDGEVAETTFDDKGTTADSSEWFADLHAVDTENHFGVIGRQVRFTYKQSEFAGLMDDIRVYDRPLTAAEVAQLAGN